MDEWIAYRGGREDIAPIECHVWCDILMQDGEVFSGFAFNFSWREMKGYAGNIVAYRIPALDEIETPARRKV